MGKKCEHCRQNLNYELQKKLFRLRQRVHDLFFLDGMSKRSISKRLKVSLNFVLSWTKKKRMNFQEDKRGWLKNKSRKWEDSIQKKVEAIHCSLTERNCFYTGATAIMQEWLKTISSAPPALRTIGWMLKRLGLSSSHKRTTHKGAARYLCYPEH